MPATFPKFWEYNPPGRTTDTQPPTESKKEEPVVEEGKAPLIPYLKPMKEEDKSWFQKQFESYSS